jgi:hypothetical protein
VDSFEWIFRELDGALAQDKLRAIEEAVHAPHPRTGGPLAGFTFAELEERLDVARSAPSLDRARAWRDRFNYETQRERDAYPLDYVEKYLSKCREFARLYLREEQLAAAVHERARSGSWPAELLSRRTDQPAPTAGSASTLAAFWSGASWWPDHASQRRAAARFFAIGRRAKFNFNEKPL